MNGNRVQMSEDMARFASDPGARLVLTHNHPDSLSFSQQDILTAANNPGLLLLYAEGHDGTSYTVDAPDPVSSEEYETVALEVRGVIRKAVRSGDISTEAASSHYNHIVTTALDRIGLLHYTASMEGGRLSSYMESRDAIDAILTTVVQRLAP